MRQFFAGLYATTVLGSNPYADLNQEYFNKAVRPIFERHCSACHSSLPGQDWTDYGSAVQNKGRINLRVFIMRDMPPMSINKMNGQEKATLKQWVNK